MQRVFSGGAVGADPDGVGAGGGFDLADIGVFARLRLFALIEDLERGGEKRIDLRVDGPPAESIGGEVAQLLQEVGCHVADRTGRIGRVHRSQREEDAVARGLLV